jgi:hypothetical protein
MMTDVRRAGEIPNQRLSQNTIPQTNCNTESYQQPGNYSVFTISDHWKRSITQISISSLLVSSKKSKFHVTRYLKLVHKLPQIFVCHRNHERQDLHSVTGSNVPSDNWKIQYSDSCLLLEIDRLKATAQNMKLQNVNKGAQKLNYFTNYNSYIYC